MILTEKELGTVACALMEYTNRLKYKLENDELFYMESEILQHKIKDAESLAVRVEDE